MEVKETSKIEFDGPKVVKVKRTGRAGVFGLLSYEKSTTTLGCEIAKSGFNTGLTKEEETYFEDKLNLKPGELSKHSKWWNEVFNTEHNLRFKNTKTNELILDNPINQLKYKVLLANTKVANSELEKNKPGIVFYIDNVEAKAKAEIQQLNFELEGMKLIVKATPDEKKSFLRLFGKIGIEDMSDDNLSSQLYLELKKDPKNFFDIMTDKELRVKAFIKELEEYKLIRRTGNYYKHNDDTIATSTDEAVAYFNDIKHQDVKLVLETSLTKIKKKGK